MCGILGTLNIPFDQSVLDLMRHRGPDDAGMARLMVGRHAVALGHQRLSILDLSQAGHQPMLSAGWSASYRFQRRNLQSLRFSERFAGTIPRAF